MSLQDVFRHGLSTLAVQAHASTDFVHSSSAVRLDGWSSCDGAMGSDCASGAKIRSVRV